MKCQPDSVFLILVEDNQGEGDKKEKQCDIY
jgi:hypothetical protein